MGKWVRHTWTSAESAGRQKVGRRDSNRCSASAPKKRATTECTQSPSWCARSSLCLSVCPSVDMLPSQTERGWCQTGRPGRCQQKGGGDKQKEVGVKQGRGWWRASWNKNRKGGTAEREVPVCIENLREHRVGCKVLRVAAYSSTCAAAGAGVISTSALAASACEGAD